MKLKRGKVRRNLAFFLALALIFTTFLGDVNVVYAEVGNETETNSGDTMLSSELAPSKAEPETMEGLTQGVTEQAADAEPEVRAQSEVQKTPQVELQPEVQPEPENSLENVQYAGIGEFYAACEVMNNAADLDSVFAALERIRDIYNRLSPEDQASAADQWARVQAYADQFRAEKAAAEIETADPPAQETAIIQEDPKTETKQEVQPKVQEELKTGAKPQAEPEVQAKPEVQTLPEEQAQPKIQEETKITEKTDLKKQYADIGEFYAACESMGDAGDLESVIATLEKIEDVYGRLSPEDQESVADQWSYIQAYAADVRAGNPDSEIEPEALLLGEKFKIQVNIGYLDGDVFVKTGSKTVIGTCKDRNGHSGFNHTMEPAEILREAGYPNSTYRVTSGSNWGPPASTTRVTYNITGSAPYKADQAFWIIGEAPSTEPDGDGNGGGNNGNGNQDVGSGKYSWKQTIVFHANYPGGSDPQKKVTYTVCSWTMGTRNEPLGVTFSGCGFTVPDGYTVDWWYTTANKKYTDSNPLFPFDYNNRNTTTHLYAHYTPTQNIFSMTYDANGGTVEGMPSHTVTVETTDTSYNFNSLEPTRNGYNFLGWYTTQSGGTEVTWPQTLDTANSKKTVYAHWEQKSEESTKAQVVYKPGEGSGSDVTEDVTANLQYTIKSTEAVNFTAPEGKIFSHWQKDNGMYFAGNIFTPAEGSTNTFTAIWKDDDSENGNATYKVQWFDDDGNLIDFKPEETRRGTAGHPVSATVADKIVSGYKYNSEDQRNVDSAILAADGSTVLKLYFTAMLWAKWVDEDGIVLWGPQYFEKGTEGPKADEYKGQTPTKENDADYTYTFKEWGKTVDGDGNITYQATYESAPRPKVQVTVTWVDEDEKTVLDGPKAFYKDEKEPEYEKDVPTKEEDKNYTYKFSGWNRSEDNAGNVTYTATYTPTEKKVTVTWVDENNTELYKLTEVRKTEIPEGDKYKDYSKKENPTKPEDEDYTYKFDGWKKSEDKDGNVIYTATYTPTPKEVDPTPENPTPEDPTPETPTPEDPTPENPTPEEPTPENPTPEDPTPENPTPEDPTPETPTPENPTVTPTPTTPTLTPPTPATPVSTTPTLTPPAPAAPAPTVTPTVTPASPTPVIPAVTPAVPTPLTPVTPVAEQAEPTVQPEVRAVANVDTPLANTEIKDAEIPLASNGGRWALINFALMNLSIFESLMLLIGYFVQTKKSSEEEEEKERKLKKKGIIRLISLPIAIISLIAFFLTENIWLPTRLVDRYTFMMAVIAIFQTVVVVFSRKEEDIEEKKPETELA